MEKGIIFLSTNSILNFIEMTKESNSTIKYALKLSSYLIYNDNVYDLVDGKAKTKINQDGDFRNQILIDGLSQKEVKGIYDLQSLFHHIEKNKIVIESEVQTDSFDPKSHKVYVLNLIKVGSKKITSIGLLTFIEMASSEIIWDPELKSKTSNLCKTKACLRNHYDLFSEILEANREKENEIENKIGKSALLYSLKNILKEENIILNICCASPNEYDFQQSLCWLKFISSIREQIVNNHKSKRQSDATLENVENVFFNSNRDTLDPDQIIHSSSSKSKEINHEEKICIEVDLLIQSLENSKEKEENLLVLQEKIEQMKKKCKDFMKQNSDSKLIKGCIDKLNNFLSRKIEFNDAPKYYETNKKLKNQRLHPMAFKSAQDLNSKDASKDDQASNDSNEECSAKKSENDDSNENEGMKDYQELVSFDCRKKVRRKINNSSREKETKMKFGEYAQNENENKESDIGSELKKLIPAEDYSEFEDSQKKIERLMKELFNLRVAASSNESVKIINKYDQLFEFSYKIKSKLIISLINSAYNSKKNFLLLDHSKSKDMDKLENEKKQFHRKMMQKDQELKEFDIERKKLIEEIEELKEERTKTRNIILGFESNSEKKLQEKEIAHQNLLSKIYEENNNLRLQIKDKIDTICSLQENESKFNSQIEDLNHKLTSESILVNRYLNENQTLRNEIQEYSEKYKESQSKAFSFQTKTVMII